MCMLALLSGHTDSEFWLFGTMLEVNTGLFQRLLVYCWFWHHTKHAHYPISYASIVVAQPDDPGL